MIIVRILDELKQEVGALLIELIRKTKTALVRTESHEEIRTLRELLPD